MIRKIQPTANYDLIKKSTYQTIDLLKANPNSKKASKVYSTYLTEGKKAPGYASTIMKIARNDASLNDVKEMLDGNISSDTFRNLGDNVRTGFRNLSLSKTKEMSEFNNAGKEMYPKTWDIREKILPWYRDTSEHRYPSSELKDLKKDFWATMERNAKIKAFRDKYGNCN